MNTPNATQSPVVIDAGDMQTAVLIPNLARVSVPPVRGIHVWLSKAFNWRVAAAVLSASTVAMAGTVGVVWATHQKPVGVVLAPDTEVPSIETRAPAAPPAVRIAPVAVVTAPARSRSATNAMSRVSRSARTVVDASRTATAPNAPVMSCAQQCAGNVDCLLACPYDGHASGLGMIPEVPSREQVDMAAQTVRGSVMMCGLGLRDAPRTVDVLVTFGGNGMPRSVTALGAFGATGPGACIERAVRRAHVARFSNETFEVHLTFTVQ